MTPDEVPDELIEPASARPEIGLVVWPHELRAILAVVLPEHEKQLQAELAEAKAAIERVTERAKSATNSGFGKLCCCFDCEEAQENGRDAPHETTWTAWTLDPAAVLHDLEPVHPGEPKTSGSKS